MAETSVAKSGIGIREASKPRKPEPPITCGGCDAIWTGISRAHCGACHETFAGVSLFDAHRSQEGEHGACISPETVTSRGSARLMFLREDGLWHGPEMTEEQKFARFGEISP